MEHEIQKRVGVYIWYLGKHCISVAERLVPQDPGDYRIEKAMSEDIHGCQDYDWYKPLKTKRNARSDGARANYHPKQRNVRPIAVMQVLASVDRVEIDHVKVRYGPSFCVLHGIPAVCAKLPDARVAVTGPPQSLRPTHPHSGL